MNRQDVLKSIEERRQKLLALLMEKQPEEDYYGDYIVWQLYFFDDFHERVNDRLHFLTQWFEVQTKRNPQCEIDFVAFNLMKAVYFCADRLSRKVSEGIDELLLKHDFESIYKSENHMLLFHTTRLLFSQLKPNEFFEVYNKSGAELFAEDTEYLTGFLKFRARQGWAEFDSYGYAGVVVDCLLSLYELCANKELKLLAEKSLNLILLDMLADSWGPIYGGAHGRVYQYQIMDRSRCKMFWVYYYYFGIDDVENIEYFQGFDLVSSGFCPADYVYGALAEKPQSYENYESKHLHCISSDLPHRQLPQEAGSINKYTYVTPDYVIGAINHQDSYPEGCDAAWYAHHEQHEWDLTLTDGKNIRIFTHHPGCAGTEGQEHGGWTGDLGCCCGRFFCKKNVVMALYDIPDGEGEMIHAYVPHRFFEERQMGKYLFLKHKQVYISLWFSNGYNYAEGEDSEIEVCSYGKEHLVICEVGTEKDNKSFDDFIEQIMSEKIIFDRVNKSANYKGMYICGDIRMDNGKAVSFPYDTYSCPFLYEQFNSGRVMVNNDTIIDFT